MYLAALLATSAAVSEPALHVDLECAPGGAEPVVLALRATTQVRFAQVPPGALWEVEEAGIELILHGSAVPGAPPQEQGVAVGQRPPRYGLAMGQALPGQTLEIAAVSPGPDVRGFVRLYCAPSPVRVAEAACLADSAAFTEAAQAVAMAPGLPGRCAALALHLAGALSQRGNDQALAYGHYQAAMRAWQALDDPVRAAAAQLGQAEVVWRQGDHVASLQLAEAAGQAAQAQGVDYLATRARSQSCLALRGVGRLAEGLACQQAVLERFLALSETSEAVGAVLSAAAMAREDGRRDLVAGLAARLAEVDESALTPMMRGRLHHLRAGLALDDGFPQAALAALVRAMDEFDAIPSPQWQAASLLLAARVNAAFGGRGEAQYLARAAADAFRAIAMPEREAGALLLLAQLHAEAGDAGQALQAADAAAARYAQAARPQLKLAAAMTGLLAEPTPARLVAFRALLEGALERPPRLQFDLALAQARVALVAGDVRHAQAQLAGLPGQVPDLGRWIALVETQARVALAEGERAQAQRILESAIARVQGMVDGIGDASLAHLAARRLQRLSRLWIDALPTGPADDPVLVARVGHTLLATDPFARLARSAPAAPGGAPSADAVRTALLRRLLSEAMEDAGDEADPLEMAEIQRLLWSPASSAGSSPDATAAVWSALLDRAAAGDTVLLLGLGERQGVTLVLSGGHAQVLVHEDAPVAAALARTLRGRLEDRSVPVDAIEDVASELSSRLFAGASDAPPARLLVWTDERLAQVPLALLVWPGQPRPMVESTAVSRLLPTQPGGMARGAAAVVSHVRVLVAGEGGRAAAGLPALPVAAREDRLVAAAMPEVAVSADGLTEQGLLQALAEPGGWVHVAGHGVVHPGMQGMAGLWSASGPDEPRAFISWLALVGKRLPAALVVLNACHLGEGGQAGDGQAASFAAALKAAGAGEVVAAMWPVSDAAASVWVPAFYGALAGPAGDAAEALRTAQRALRDSRAFRHPWYWASLVHWASP
ncbi:MAG: CHAT domain-containing protein [Xanthomonadales bacterium]|nr:CHAT domain-containing protein [Xanthomonadales bacterium]